MIEGSKLRIRLLSVVAPVALLAVTAVGTYGCGHTDEGGSPAASDRESSILNGQPTVVPVPRLGADRLGTQATPQVAPAKSETSVKSVRFSEKGYRPTSLHGELSVGVGIDWQIHMVNVVTGEKRRLTVGMNRKRDAVISDSHVAWTTRSRIGELLSNLSLVRPSNQIFVMDISTGATRRITTGVARRGHLRIDGRVLVWEESRRMVGDRYTDYDIHAYDIVLDKKIPVAVAPGSQRHPAIHGDRVIWTDDRNCPGEIKIDISAGSCAGGLLDIYLYDFATGEERLVAKSAASGYHAPDIHGEHVVWRSHKGKYYENNSVYLRSLHDGRERIVATLDNGNMGSPLVSDEYVAWTVTEPCDTSWFPPRDMGTGAFVYDIGKGMTHRLTDYGEPDILLDGKVALVHEGCWFPGPVYGIFLK